MITLFALSRQEMRRGIMLATTFGINEACYQRLLHLVEQTGRPAAAEEAQLLEDVGRIRTPPRDSRLVAAHVVPVPRRTPRLGAGAEE
jgi:hypothetical protein